MYKTVNHKKHMIYDLAAVFGVRNDIACFKNLHFQHTKKLVVITTTNNLKENTYRPGFKDFS